MRKNLLYLFVFGCLESCQQDNPPSPTPTTCTEPAAYLKFKFDGTLVEMNGSLSQNSREGSIIRKEQMGTSSGTVLTNANYGFSIIATKNYFYSDDGEPIIEIEIKSPTLSVTTYPSASINYVITYYPLQGVYCSPPNCSSTLSGTSFTVTITKLENGYADGTFSGILSKDITAIRYQVTEGEFHNVKVIQ